MLLFRKLTLWTLVAVYVLILVGGVVRSTGSGMGCPDWPKCFGSWTPPTSVHELPQNYKESYAEYRHKKNVKFARYLRAIGFGETADRLLADKSVLVEADFNPVKTWIEYFNRIVGVIIGMMITAVAIYSMRLRRVDRVITVVSILTLLLVIFQGWIGSFVVSSNLTPWTITVHMFLALVVVALLIYLLYRSEQGRATGHFPPLHFWWLMACMAVLLVQVLLGTRVREVIDTLLVSLPRAQVIDAIGETFSIHRSFSWIVLILHVGLVVNLRKTRGLKSFSLALILLILGTVLTGIGMAYFSIPPVLQPLHLLLATVCFGLQFYLLLKLGNVNKHALAGT